VSDCVLLLQTHLRHVCMIVCMYVWSTSTCVFSGRVVFTKEGTTKKVCGSILLLHTYLRHTYMHAWTRKYIDEYIHPYIHTYIHTCIHTYIQNVWDHELLLQTYLKDT